MLLSVNEIVAGYGRANVLHGLSLEIADREIVALLGVNGSGKSTALRAISGVLPIRSGSIAFAGKPVRRAPESRVRDGMCHVPEGRGILASLTVGQNLRLGASGRRASRSDIAETEEEILGAFPELRAKLREPAGALSGGQQQRLAIARALMASPELIMIDEMSFGLAPILVNELLNLIVRLRAEHGTAFLLVEQTAAVLDIADRAYVLSRGQVALAGLAADLVNSGDLERAYLG